jgi:ABC-type multidrug transport system permease subunit
MKRFLAIFHARNIEFFRDRAALSWNIALPILLVFGFAFMFSDSARDVYKVGVLGDYEQSNNAFYQTDYIQFIKFNDIEKAKIQVKHHQLDMLIDDNTQNYWINSSSTKGYILERVFWATAKTQEKKIKQFQQHRMLIEGREIRYVDWVLPGILAMNMMFSCLFGIGYVIVRYRKNGVLKRLKATPLTALEFLSAQILSRMMLIMTITITVYFGCDFFIDFFMLGSLFTLLLIFSLGAICLISLGLVVSTRTTSEEFAGGMLNLFSWPMMILSGVWFSLEGVHPAFKFVAQFLPLTHIVDGARAVMNDGAGLVDIMPQISTLLVMTFIFLLFGTLRFRWE